ncbi:hypothetical protein [Viscerimonas tarda]
MEQREKISFVKYYPGLSVMFKPVETLFILHMVRFEFLKTAGFRIRWSKAEYARRMGLKECAFIRCVKRLSAMKLLEVSHNPEGNRVFYSFNMSLYYRLVEILSATSDHDRLTAFCNRQFKKAGRPIESITDDEIRELRD